MPTTTRRFGDCRYCSHSRPLTWWERLRRAILRRTRARIACTVVTHSFMQTSAIPDNLCHCQCVFYDPIDR